MIHTLFGHTPPSLPLTESDYLPPVASPLFEGPWLVLAPHPDDETYGMGGSIAAARKAGVEVKVVVLTDGALGGEAPDLRSRRQHETRQALNALGGAEVVFWDQPDRGLVAEEGLIARLQALMTAFDPRGGGTVFFPGPLEPHPDHRACACLAWEAVRRSAFHLKPVSYDISVQSPCTVLIDITESMPLKEAAMACHGSQEHERPYRRRIAALNAARTWSLPQNALFAESFFCWPHHNAPFAHVVARFLAMHTAYGLGSSPQEAVDAPLHEALAQLAAIKQSRSWQLTAPLRNTARFVCRLRTAIMRRLARPGSSMDRTGSS